MSVVDDTFAEQVRNLLGMYQGFMAKIDELDEALDSQTDAASAGKRALRNALVKDYEKRVSEQNDETPETEQVPVFEGLIEKLSELDEELRIGVYTALVRALNSTFEKPTDEYLEKQIAENKRDLPNVTYTDDQIKAMSEQRSALYKNAKSIRELAFLYGGTEEQFPPPKVRTGTVGKRGPRAISLYKWSIDGEELAEDKNNLLWIAKQYGFGTAVDLKKAIMAHLGVKDLKNPPSPITMPLPENHVLSGTRDMSEPVSEDDDDENEDEENGSEEVEEVVETSENALTI